MPNLTLDTTLLRTLTTVVSDSKENIWLWAECNWKFWTFVILQRMLLTVNHKVVSIWMKHLNLGYFCMLEKLLSFFTLFRSCLLWGWVNVPCGLMATLDVHTSKVEIQRQNGPYNKIGHYIWPVQWALRYLSSHQFIQGYISIIISYGEFGDIYDYTCTHAASSR